MSKNAKLASRVDLGFVEVKSKFNAEFRRFSVDRSNPTRFEDFEKLLVNLHCLHDIPVVICYTDPEGDLLPINNNENYTKALTTAKPILRVLVQIKGESFAEVSGYGTLQKKRGAISKLVSGEPRLPTGRTPIGMPQDFRRVSAIIDIDVVPETQRRVKLMKNGSDKPLGFYIRDGTSVRVTSHGLEKVPGIFISRLVPGGLAETTGLLAVNDEVCEVNGIEVTGKTLDQVTDMMVANSANLIITVKPVNQRNNISPKRGVIGRVSNKSLGSMQSGQSGLSFDSDEVRDHIQEEDEDEVQEHITDNGTLIKREPTPPSDKLEKTSQRGSGSGGGTPKATRAKQSTNHSDTTQAISSLAISSNNNTSSNNVESKTADSEDNTIVTL